MKRDKLWIPSASPFYFFGAFYYLIIPIFALFFFKSNRIVITASPYLDQNFLNFRYITDFCLVFFSWYIGYSFVKIIKVNNISSLDYPSHSTRLPKIIILLLGAYYFIIVKQLYQKGIYLFSGYTTYNPILLGQLATITYMCSWFYIYFVSKRIKSAFLFFFCISATTMMSLGSRMFPTLGLISILSYYLSKNKVNLRNPINYIFLLFLFLLMLATGLARSGKEVSIQSLLSIFIAEPVFTLSSFSNYTNISGRPLISFPVEVLTSIINFIPTVFAPSKIDFLKELDTNTFMSTPFGAKSLLLSLYSNFGIFFPLYLFLMGLYTGLLKKLAHSSQFFLAVYIAILPLHMFHIFREGFITSIKLLFFNSLILPFILILVYKNLFYTNKI
jgi:hypothetical protein